MKCFVEHSIGFEFARLYISVTMGYAKKEEKIRKTCRSRDSNYASYAILANVSNQNRLEETSNLRLASE